MTSYAITGASRGLGLEFVTQLSSNPSNLTFALVRNPSTADALTTLASTRPNIHILKADNSDVYSLQAAAVYVASINDGRLDILINNAALVETEAVNIKPTAFSENYELMRSAFGKSFDVNVYGAIYVTNAFLPLIEKGERRKIVHLSTGMADPELVIGAGVAVAVPYSVSKAALNIVVAKFAVEVRQRGVVVVAMSPGWVDTDIGPMTREGKAAEDYLASRFQLLDKSVKGRIKKEDSVRMQLEVIEGLDMEKSGRMISHHGDQNWF